MKKIEFVNGTTVDGAKTFNDMQNNVEEVFNGEEPMGSIVVDDVSCKNKFNKHDISTGQLNITDGNINTTITMYRTSNYIDIVDSPTWFINTQDWFQICYYDSNKIFISGEEYQLTEGHSTIVPTNAKYMRISTGINSVDTTQIEKGDKFTSYTAYKNFENRIDIITEQEIATNEYVDGKRVYVKKINFGYLENSTNKAVHIGLTDVELVRVEGVAKNGTLQTFLPSMYTEFTLDNGWLNVLTSKDLSSYEAKINIYYTKASSVSTMSLRPDTTEQETE